MVCYNLTSVTIPDKITTLSAYSFTGTSSLKSLSLPAGLTKIEEGAFLQSHIRDYEGTTIYYNGNPVDASGTASTWYLDKEMTQSFDPANTNRQITDDLDLYTAWTASAKTGTLTMTNGSFTYEKQDGEEVTGKTGEIPVGTLVTVSFDKDAGDPAPAAEPAYIDIDADDTDAQNAAQWAVENELMELPDADNTPDQFAPCAAVSTVDVIHAWKKAQSVKQG